MDDSRKVIIDVPSEPPDQTQRAGNSGITQTVRTGAPSEAATEQYVKLRELRGKHRFIHTSAELKADR